MQQLSPGLRRGDERARRDPIEFESRSPDQRYNPSQAIALSSSSWLAGTKPL